MKSPSNEKIQVMVGDGFMLTIECSFSVQQKEDRTLPRRVAAAVAAFSTTLQIPIYDNKFGDERLCKCGHSYYRHFDTYEDMAPVGCKYCGCRIFTEKK